jgi:hypothetical protein
VSCRAFRAQPSRRGIEGLVDQPVGFTWHGSRNLLEGLRASAVGERPMPSDNRDRATEGRFSHQFPKAGTYL